MNDKFRITAATGDGEVVWSFDLAVALQKSREFSRELGPAIDKMLADLGLVECDHCGQWMPTEMMTEHPGPFVQCTECQATTEQVVPADACPNCGERRQDLLVWFENADQVQCESCGHVYAPPRAAKSAGEPRSEPRSW